VARAIPLSQSEPWACSAAYCEPNNYDRFAFLAREVPILFAESQGPVRGSKTPLTLSIGEAEISLAATPLAESDSSAFPLWLIAVIAAIVVIGGATLIILAKRRRKQRETESDSHNR
jgi:hypothetical protein